ncbi:MAG TPA: hypothetical protein VLL05_05160 [Terriglobales bacterium]|nr:hypothetical protein [Terriglobales bacterium]
MDKPAAAPNKKRSNLYEAAFKDAYHVGLNKRRVAEAAKKLLAERKEDEETRKRLGTLSTAIVSKLTDTAPAEQASTTTVKS